MSRINPLSREISAKIVFYGPGLSGKTTSLQHIHDHVRPAQRGELISLATEGDRTIFFDFLPLAFERVRGMSLRLQLYTVPGQVYYAATRKLVLNGADAVVFVADSQAAAAERNRESLLDLEANLAELGLELPGFPLVLQYNKRDLEGVLPVSELDLQLNPHGAPAFETCAVRGEGVFEALKAIVRLTIHDLKARRQAASQPRRQDPFEREAAAGDLSAPGLAIRGADGAAVSEATTEMSSDPASPREVVPSSGEPNPGGGVPSTEWGATAATPLRTQAAVVALSFAALLGDEHREALTAVEEAIRGGAPAESLHRSVLLLDRILQSLPGVTEADGPMARAVALGLEGREFLRLARLGSTPAEAISLADALFALHLVVAAGLKLRRL